MLLEISLFYLNSRATVHISPDPYSFASLTPIQQRSIQEVGGSTIAVMGIGSICLQTSKGTYLELDNVLHVPKSTIHLLSISRVAKQAGITVTFNNTDITLIRTSIKAIIATATLILKQELYALDISTHQAYAIHVSPNLTT